MKKLLPIIVLSILLANIPDSQAKSKIHYNELHIIGVNAQYTVDNFCITDNQPYKKSNTKYYNYGYSAEQFTSLNVPAGRHASKSVAKNCFSNWISPHQNTFNNKPKKLNFAIRGNLTLYSLDKKGNTIWSNPSIFNDIVVAQGHSGASNNWWFGGKTCQIEKKFYVTCTDTKGTSWCFRRGSAKSAWNGNYPNDVYVSQGKCLSPTTPTTDIID